MSGVFGGLLILVGIIVALFISIPLWMMGGTSGGMGLALVVSLPFVILGVLVGSGAFISRRSRFDRRHRDK
ncbi:MAG: hypothetical protein B7Y08_06040 [Rhodospirillales bacterium 24-66-33]|nr:MAG: hypothetical protein B7Y57_15780 [Rhodospirillales bacterium 35-66-84]OYZ95987.1 MAG: hypothetical protein B7Y08_06040 [Rhodospirillales bacterium 24-66-33]OZB25868.1 MAG: hypothetical protein B7X63_10945 [Rhodospirillales bacterium 39-66-50]